MKTILLVDDERPARELLKMSLDWSALDFEPPYEAANGKAALDLYINIRPDFVITDIQMPVMDGLELIVAIKKINPSQRIVILSCHESFLFAQRAMKLGVTDYLIKDALNANTLADILLSSAAYAAQENVLIPPSPSSEIISSALQNATTEEAGAQLQMLLGSGRQYFCCAVSAWKATPDYATAAHIQEAISAFFDDHLGGDIYWADGGVLYILMLMPYSISRMENLRTHAIILQELRAAVFKNSMESVSIGVSTASGSAAEIRQKLDEAKTALDSFIFFGKGKNIYYDDTQQSLRVSSIKSLENRMVAAKAAIELCDAETVRNEITLLYKKDLPGIMQYNYLQHVNTLLLASLTEKCLSQNIPFKDVFGSDMLSELPTNGSCETSEEMLQWYLKTFERYFAVIKGQQEYVQSPRTQKIKQYIDKNYFLDISLETVAEQFGLHKVYLAKIFKTDVGSSVNEYIRLVKVTHAKELLAKKDLKANTIIEMLGFNSPQTFYNMFKHCEGISPKEYRQRILSESHDDI